MVRQYRVQYDFTANDAVELSVRKGELVNAIDGAVQDGWIKVELAGDSRRRGFVPATFIVEVPQSAASGASRGTAAASGPSTFAAAPRVTAAAQQAPPSLQGASYTAAALSIGSKWKDQLQRSASNVEHRRSSSPALEGSGPNAVASPNAVVEAFMKNEVYFKQLMKQRQEAMSKIENALAEAAADCAQCKDKNSMLARKLRDLDAAVEKERRKWRDRVEEEKLLMMKPSGARPFSGVATTTTTTTIASSSVTAASRNLGRDNNDVLRATTPPRQR